MKRIIFQRPSGEKIIKIKAMYMISGRIRIQCDDEFTMQWVMEEISKLPLQNDQSIAFRAWPLNDLPRLIKYTMFVQNRDCDEIDEFEGELIQKYVLPPKSIHL